jgi:UrcA family protein
MRHRLSLRLCGVGTVLPVVAAFAAFSAPAHEAPAQSIAVNVGDLDLSRPEGIGRLYQRIQKAARQVCNPQGLTIYLPQMRSYRECYQLTVDDATAQVDRLIRARSRSGKTIDAVERERRAAGAPP